MPPADRYHQRPPTVLLYQSVMAKTDVQLSEYAKFTAQLVAAMVYVTFRAKEVVVARGSKPPGMYLVHLGIVASAGSLFPKNKFFCSEGVLFHGTTDREYRSVTSVYVNLVSKESFVAIVATCQFPAIEQWLRRHRRMLAMALLGRLAREFTEMRDKVRVAPPFPVHTNATRWESPRPSQFTLTRQGESRPALPNTH